MKRVMTARRWIWIDPTVHVGGPWKKSVSVALYPMLLGAAFLWASLSSAAELLQPLPENTPRSIQNPYYAKPTWKLWAKDPSPVATNSTGETQPIAPLPEDKRKYPTFPKTWKTGAPRLEPAKNPTVSGSWDDCYISLDDYHTRLSQPTGQFIVGGKMRHEGDYNTRLMLGANFTSQSYAERGRHIVDDTFNNLITEKYSFFAGCVRATPSHQSYQDTRPEGADDLYDGLYAHSYHSVGQSGSEIHALYKMMLAGAALPRETKDLLKYHGAYAPVLLTLFKAALPFTDAEGKELPYEHELRHRPAYSSHGTPQHAHYCFANIFYHSYDDDLHIHRMVNAARTMTAPPPVAIMKLIGLAAEKDGTTAQGQLALPGRLMSACLTHFRLWGKPGETLTAIVDLNGSYDLKGKRLTFTAQPLYPNQKNVVLQQAKPGIFVVQVKYDPKLPKGRIPVIFTARNDTDIPSNPVFLNFYWPGENEMPDYGGKKRPDGSSAEFKTLPVNVNKRPDVTFTFPGNTLRCKPGETAKFTFEAKDPEGYPLSVYRWPNQPGKVAAGTFTWAVPADAPPSIQPITLVFSDGTGGYTGKEVLLLISPDADVLPENWALTTVNRPKQAGTITFDGSTLTVTDQACQPEPNNRKEVPKGVFVYRPAASPTDMTLRLKIEKTAQVGLLVKNQLDGNSIQAGIGWSGGAIRTFGRHGGDTHDAKTTERKDPSEVTLRLITRGRHIAGLSSTDGTHWTQLFIEPSDLNPTYYAGVYCGGRSGEKKSPVTIQFAEPTSPLPVLLPPKGGVNVKTNKYAAPLKLEMLPLSEGNKIVYTLDGKDPAAGSSVYEKPIILEKPGDHSIRFAVLKDGKMGQVVLCDFPIEEPKQ